MFFLFFSVVLMAVKCWNMCDVLFDVTWMI